MRSVTVVLPASMWAAMPMFLVLDSLSVSRFTAKIWTIMAGKSTGAGFGEAAKTGPTEVLFLAVGPTLPFLG